MSTLWNPDQRTRSSLSCGERKERLGRMKLADQIIAVPCPECESPVYFVSQTGGYLTLGGSNHECIGLKAIRKASVPGYAA